ncbi:MAG: hypothetical protein MI923_06050 [Phycisphaerales bacterium]|nr:hypothetical protein [Phycisphaerales bacterium]
MFQEKQRSRNDNLSNLLRPTGDHAVSSTQMVILKQAPTYAYRATRAFHFAGWLHSSTRFMKGRVIIS